MQDLIAFMEKHCTKILDIYRKESRYLYHGNHRPTARVIMGRSREDRAPKDTPQFIQDRFDRTLKKAGFTALRANSIFCTSDKRYAASYGQLFVIFPIDGFTYSWSAKAYDFYTAFAMYEGPDSEFYQDLKTLSPMDFVKKYEYKNNIGLEKALENRHEVCISGSYIAIEDNSLGPLGILDHFRLY
jgi:hypothetical protein